MNLVRSANTNQSLDNLDIFVVRLGEDISKFLDAEATDTVEIAAPAGVSVKLARSSRPRNPANGDYTPVKTAEIEMVFTEPGQHLVEIKVLRNGLLLDQIRELYEAT